MNNCLPIDWSFGELAKSGVDILDGDRGKEYPKDNDFYDNEYCLFLSAKNVTKSGFQFNHRAFITKVKDQKLRKGKLFRGDIIITTRGTVGNIAHFDERVPFENIRINSGMAIIRNVEGKVDSVFLNQLLHSQIINEQLESLTSGSAQPQLTIGIIKELSLPVPPLPEQQKIAQILTSVDEVIEKTQAQIDKLKDLKTAMMQELLTKGIGHIEFKDSPVGRIPVGWEVKTLEALSSFVTSGSRGWAQYYSSTGAIFIRIGNLTREHINFRFKDIIYVTPPNSAEGKRTLVQEGDVLISITADLGIIAVVNESIGEAYVNQHVSLVRLDDPSMARWVGHFLAFEDSRKQFTANNDAGAKAGLNLTAIRKTQVALPSKNERRKIVEALDSVDKLISEKRRKLNVTNDTKKALMQDLLTGKVRVS
jgi:type I restriction enzyme S subunit